MITRSHGPPWECSLRRSASSGLRTMRTQSVQDGIPTETVGTSAINKSIPCLDHADFGRGGVGLARLLAEGDELDVARRHGAGQADRLREGALAEGALCGGLAPGRAVAAEVDLVLLDAPV